MDRLRDILAVAAGAEALPRDLTPALAWELAAGPELAARARCVELRGGVLRLAAADAGARAQLLSVAPELRRGLEKLLGPGQVQRLEFQS